MSRQDNSDPLPYVQVDRAVKPKAVLLANALGVSTQHALGSLVEWWELCGDPRDLEAICSATPEGEEPAVLLQGDDASLRFKLASGRDVEPVVLVRLQLLEPKADGRFRVRGMSRYFEPIARRLHNRKVASAGGKASAAARLAATGSAQPSGGKGFEARSDGGSDVAQAVAQAEPNPEPKRNRTQNGSADRSETEHSGQRSAVSGQLQLEKTAPAPRAPRETDLLCEDFREIIGKAYVWADAKDGAAFAKLKRTETIEEIRARWKAGLKSEDKWRSVRTVAQLASKWNDLAPSRGSSDVMAPTTQTTIEITNGF